MSFRDEAFRRAVDRTDEPFALGASVLVGRLEHAEQIAADLGKRCMELEAIVGRTHTVLRQIADPSYTGNYSPREVVEILRTWACEALNE